MAASKPPEQRMLITDAQREVRSIFCALYGMRSFFALSAILITSGITLALYFPSTFTAGGWVTGAALLLFAIVGHLEAKWAA